MAKIDPKLVQDIAAKVVAAMASAGAPQNTSRSLPGSPVTVHPPAGTCTGDYSKFKENKTPAKASADDAASAGAGSGGASGGVVSGGAASGTTVSGAAASDDANDPAIDQPALSGILTATQIQAAIAASPTGVALLAGDARLSPLAADFAREHPQKIRRLDATGNGTKTARQPASSDAWLWWIDGYCPAVQQLVTQQRQQLRAAPASHAPTSLASVVRALAADVKANRVAGGLLFVRSAVRAVCFANRNPALRAVVGTCGEAVELGISELGANVLVIEYPHHGLKSMAAMAERMTQQMPTPPAALQRQLADLQQ